MVCPGIAPSVAFTGACRVRMIVSALSTRPSSTIGTVIDPAVVPTGNDTLPVARVKSAPPPLAEPPVTL